MTLTRLMIGFCLSFFVILSKAQETGNQLAYSKPITLKNTTELILEHIKESPFSELYDTWNNTQCDVKTEVIPENYEIDLRGFSMPIEQDFITSNFGKRRNRNHNGIDIKAYRGDTIYSAFGGKVRVVKYESRGYGNVVVIRHWNGLETIYAHLSKQIVKVNDVVEAGQPIGLAGNTGRSTGTHLHFETRFCGIPINPLEIFSFKDKDVVGDVFSWKKK